ncbi:colipase-like protein 2 [Loxodonta africana]|uniref:colipase-like protein 2 n=1 Tax=Loxodonta africana TaxID=9785 RepID=UPI0030CCA89A
MATAFALLAGVLLLCWGEPLRFRRVLLKIDGAECSHHSECHSDCCLINFDNGGAFCAPKAGYTMMCLPQWLELFKGRDGVLLIFESPTPSLVPAHNQGGHQHHLPLPTGLELHSQGLAVSPPVSCALEGYPGWSLSPLLPSLEPEALGAPTLL